MDKDDVSRDMWFLARQRLPDPPQARDPLPSGARLRVAHGGWLSDLEGQHKNLTRAAGVQLGRREDGGGMGLYDFWVSVLKHLS